MEVFCQGKAIIRLGGLSGKEFVFTPEDLDWEQPGVILGPDGPRVEYTAYFTHPELGFLSWQLWEYPEGVEGERETDVGENTLIQDFDYRLEPTSEEKERYGVLAASLVRWFRERYEDPAARTSYESAQGGYLWNHGGPFDAQEEIEKYIAAPEAAVVEAVREIEAGGTVEWAGRDWWDRGGTPTDDYDEEDEGLYSLGKPFPDISEFDFSEGESDEEFADGEPETRLDIPEQSAGLVFAVSSRGLIEIAQQDSLREDEVDAVAGLRSVQVGVSHELLTLLNGSNAFAALTGVVKQYHSAVAGDTFPTDLIYSLGVRLDNYKARLQAQIDSGDSPVMSMEMGEALDSLLALHGPMVLSTARGRELVALALEFSRSELEIDNYRDAARPLSRALQDAKSLVSQEAAELLVGVNEDVMTGPHPARSLQVAHSANRNVLITIATVCAPILGTVIYAGLEASVPGVALSTGVTKAADGAWNFLWANAPVLQNFVAVSGMADMVWLRALLNRVSAIGPRE